MESDNGEPKSEYRWRLDYGSLDDNQETYTVSFAFLGPTTYHLVIIKQLPNGNELTLQDIDYVNEDGTDYYFEGLEVQKASKQKAKRGRADS